jgi:hypothetical protein
VEVSWCRASGTSASCRCISRSISCARRREELRGGVRQRLPPDGREEPWCHGDPSTRQSRSLPRASAACPDRRFETGGIQGLAVESGDGSPGGQGIALTQQ